MTSAATAPSTFELRSTSVTVLSLVLRSASVDALQGELQRQYGDTPGMFDDDLVVIDLSRLDSADGVVDLADLVASLRSIGLLPVAVRGGNDAQRAMAHAAGLGDAGDAPSSLAAAAAASTPGAGSPLAVSSSAPASSPSAPSAPSATPLPLSSNAVESRAVAAAVPAASVSARPANAESAEAVNAAASTAASPVPTLVVDRPLRSGQQVYARGGDLVVLAAVNYGAEVIADGHVHVYGPLRGKAIAGAKGDVSARIFSTSLQPELLAIAGTYRTSENPLPADVVGRPAQVRLDGERLIFEPLGG